MSSTTIVSAPGKILLAGGYLVLDQAYTGLVVATSSRFYCAVSRASASSLSSTPAEPQSVRISVRAGQFPGDASRWIFDISLPPRGAPVLTQLNTDAAGRNKFVEITIAQIVQYALERLAADGEADAGAALRKRLGDAVDIVVLGDNDFYSQREQLAKANLEPRFDSLASLTPFCPLPRAIGSTNKTGLGSSAALVTSLVAGVLAHLGMVDIDDAGRTEIHALAQAAHCLAQGKVGSGFDVASAVYGTHVYRRFSPAVLEPLFGGNAQDGALLRTVQSPGWDHGAKAFRLPRGLRLLLADVDAGTDTPSFVGKVLAWRKAKPEEALRLWTSLDQANRKLERLLTSLAGYEGLAAYDEALKAAAEERVQVPRPQERGWRAWAEALFGYSTFNPVTELLGEISEAINEVREGMREMSTASGVPIEPPEQTRLLDACSALPGVLGGGVPGAGGYDAIWVLAVDAPSVAPRVEDVWTSWTEMSVSPLAAAQSDGGLQVEDAARVRGLAEALARV